MFQTTDWSRRKLEIADAFRNGASLPDEADSAIYTEIINQMGVENPQDKRILAAIVRDMIMSEQREGRPTVELDRFLVWLIKE